jgi:hypothetical protein
VRIARLSHGRHSEEERSSSVSGGPRWDTPSSVAALAQHAEACPSRPVELDTPSSSTDQILQGREYVAVTDTLMVTSSVHVHL